MVVNLVKSHGVPAFAYPSSDHFIPWPCSLVMLQDEPDALVIQFAVLLNVSIPIHGVAGEQSFVLCFDGDNLVPGTTSLGPVNVSLAQECLNTISREGSAVPQILSLTLKAPCSVRYPRALGGHETKFDTPCREVVDLANATEVRVLFDSQWLGRHRALLQSTVRSSSQLAGVPILPDSVYALAYLQATCSILRFVECAEEALPSIEIRDAVPPTIKDALVDAPPPYAHASSKRTRHTRTPTPDQRLTKRLLQDCMCAGSPTECNTDVPSPSIKSPTSSNATVEVDTVQELVQSAVDKALPAALRAHLPHILEEILPGIIAGPHSPAPPASSPASSFTSSASIHVAPTTPAALCATTMPRATTAAATVPALFRAAVNVYTTKYMQPHIAAAVAKAGQRIYDAADDVQAQFQNGMSEDFEDHRIDVQMVKDDHLVEFMRECEKKVEELAEDIAEMKERAEEEVEHHGLQLVDKVDEACSRLDQHGEKVVEKVSEGLNERAKVVLNSIRFDLTRMQRRGACGKCGCQCTNGDGTETKQTEQGQRAMSLPLP